MDIVLLGPPGSGKGTQAALMSQRLGYVSLCTGAMLRREVSLGTALGVRVEQVMHQGFLVDDHLILEIVESRLKAIPDETPVVFDGVPRTKAQAVSLDTLLKGFGRSVGRALVFCLEEEALFARVTTRAEESLEKRADDTGDVLKARLDVYREAGPKVQAFYEERGVAMSLDAARPVEDVFVEVQVAIGT